MTRRSFVVFDGNGYAAADALRVLGRVVLDPRRPLDDYQPRILGAADASVTSDFAANTQSIPVDNSKDQGAEGVDLLFEGKASGNPSASTNEPIVMNQGLVISEEQLSVNSVPEETQELTAAHDDSDTFLSEFRLRTVVDTNPVIRAELVKSRKGHIFLTNIFSASRSVDESSWRMIRATSMQTFALQQHTAAYNKLVAKYSRELETLMEQQTEGRPLYMMVTLKTAIGMRLSGASDESRATGLRGELPVAEAATAAGAPPGISSALPGRIGMDVGKDKTRREALQLVATDERAFAAEYREIERLPKNKFRLKPAADTEKLEFRLMNGVSIFSGEHLSFNERRKNQNKDYMEESDEEYR